MSGDSLQPARYRAVGLVEKSTAARERYMQPRLGQQGSELAVEQICMRSLGAVCLRGTRAEETGKAMSNKQRMRKKGSSRSAEVCGDARGNNGPINQRRLEAQKGL